MSKRFTTAVTRSRAAIALCALALFLTGCGGGRAADADANATATAVDPTAALPRPQSSSTSVTGMPAPGSGGVAIDVGPMPPGDITTFESVEDAGATMPGSVDTASVPMLEDNPETGLAATGVFDGTLSAADQASGVADAVARVARYYGAINRGDLVAAYALWGDGGAASGQTPEQFATGFADVAAIRVAPGEATAAGTGDRVDVPVTVTTTRRDGSTQTSVGLYVLRATADGRDWRIVDARLRPLQP